MRSATISQAMRSRVGRDRDVAAESITVDSLDASDDWPPSKSRRASAMSCNRHCGILPKALSQQSAYANGRVGRQHRPIGLPFQDVDQGIGERIAGNGATTGQHFIEHAAIRPDVRSSINGLPTRLLRAHVHQHPEKRGL